MTTDLHSPHQHRWTANHQTFALCYLYHGHLGAFDYSAPKYFHYNAPPIKAFYINDNLICTMLHGRITGQLVGIVRTALLVMAATVLSPTVSSIGTLLWLPYSSLLYKMTT